MPAPIYIQKQQPLVNKLLPYVAQLGLNMQRQNFLKKQAEEKAKLRPREMAIGGRKGVYNPSNQTWTEFKTSEAWSKPVTHKEGNELGLPPGTITQTGPKGKIHKVFEPKAPKEIYQTITLQDPSNPKKKRTFFRNNPTVKDLMAKGHTEVKTPATSLTINQRGAALNEAKRQLPPANMTPKDKQTYNNLTRVAEQGTGPFSMFAATTNALLGGFGIDKLFGKKGFFPDTVESRQVLRTIKQMGKAALSNSPRFPIAEQKLVDRLFPDPDKFFTNPRTEAKKLAIIRDTLNERKKSNNDIIRHAIDPEEAKKARANNNEINRLFALMKGDDSAAPPSESQITDRDIDMMNELLKQGSK
jgi:hypothetical protein